MSIQAIAWVLEYSQAEGLDRLVLIALANHASQETGECHPGYRRIAKEANCSTGSVATAVKRLETLGELTITRRGIGRATTKYHLPWLSTGLSSVQPRLNTRRPVAFSETPVAFNSEPVVRGPGLNETRTVNRTAQSAPGKPGALAPKTPRDAAEIAKADAADLADATDTEAARAEIARMHDELRRRRGTQAS